MSKYFNFVYLWQVINFDSPRGGISLVTEKGALTTSRLLVQKAILQDSGQYTCAPSNANPANARVHIVDGKENSHSFIEATKSITFFIYSVIYRFRWTSSSNAPWISLEISFPLYTFSTSFSLPITAPKDSIETFHKSYIAIN